MFVVRLGDTMVGMHHAVQFLEHRRSRTVITDHNRIKDTIHIVHHNVFIVMDGGILKRNAQAFRITLIQLTQILERDHYRHHLRQHQN
jgi:hypothetical protein